MAEYLVEGPIDNELMTRLLAPPAGNFDAGATSVFIGRVRADENGGKKVVAIEYSAYDEMVNSEATKIIDQILAGFNNVKSISLIHSRGRVGAGEISLFVMVSAGHRRQAIEACSEAVELIKARLPVWKNEIYDDNSHEWKQNLPL